MFNVAHSLLASSGVRTSDSLTTIRRTSKGAGACLGLALFASLLSQGCGMGTDSIGSTTAAMVTGGMPKCDISLLHQRIELGNTAALPGQTIVYVDGVMACVDETAKVDQIVGQLEGRTDSRVATRK